MTSNLSSAKNNTLQNHLSLPLKRSSRTIDSPPPETIADAVSSIFAAFLEPADSAPKRAALRPTPLPPPTPRVANKKAPRQERLQERLRPTALSFRLDTASSQNVCALRFDDIWRQDSDPSLQSERRNPPSTSCFALPQPPVSLPPLVCPDNLEPLIQRSAKRARKEAPRRIQDLAPFFSEFANLLTKEARFLGNGCESASFLNQGNVYKFPITHSLAMRSHISARAAVEAAEQSYLTLTPIFQTLTSITLTPTEFCHTDDMRYYMRQPYYPKAIDSDALTPINLRELRQLILSRVRADIRPSNFGVDEQGHLQFFDFNMPQDEVLDIQEMRRVWNEVTPNLGELLIEREDQVFEEQVFNFVGRPKFIHGKNLTATVVQELRQFILSKQSPLPTPSTVGIDEHGHVQFFKRTTFEDEISALEVPRLWNQVAFNLDELLTEEDDRVFASQLERLFPDHEQAEEAI